MQPIRGCRLAALATGIVFGTTSVTLAGHKDPFQAAFKLEQVACALEQEILHHFGADPSYPHYVQSASLLKVHAQHATHLLSQGTPADVVRRVVGSIERDADRVENCLEDVNYRRYGIPKECYQRAVRLADDIEDLADDLGDALEHYGRRPVGGAAFYHGPVIYEQPYSPAPIQRYEPRREFVPPAPPVIAPETTQPPIAPPAPPLPEEFGADRLNPEPVIVPAEHESRYLTPRPTPERPESRSTRQIRIGPISITF